MPGNIPEHFCGQVAIGILRRVQYFYQCIGSELLFLDFGGNQFDPRIRLGQMALRSSSAAVHSVDSAGEVNEAQYTCCATDSALQACATNASKLVYAVAPNYDQYQALGMCLQIILKVVGEAYPQRHRGCTKISRKL